MFLKYEILEILLYYRLLILHSRCEKEIENVYKLEWSQW